MILRQNFKKPFYVYTKLVSPEPEQLEAHYFFGKSVLLDQQKSLLRTRY